MFLGSSCCNIAENSTFARPLDFACRLNPSFHAFAEACATETLGAYFQVAVLLNRQSAFPILGQLLHPIITSFTSHAVLLLFGVTEEHSTSAISKTDAVGWALTITSRNFKKSALFPLNRECSASAIIQISEKEGIVMPHRAGAQSSNQPSSGRIPLPSSEKLAAAKSQLPHV